MKIVHESNNLFYLQQEFLLDYVVQFGVLKTLFQVEKHFGFLLV